MNENTCVIEWALRSERVEQFALRDIECRRDPSGVLGGSQVRDRIGRRPFPGEARRLMRSSNAFSFAAA
jgi:hypothetical protein